MLNQFNNSNCPAFLLWN